MSEHRTHSLSWEAGEVPVSELFDDPFYSRNDGRAESAFVFVNGTGLPDGWIGAQRFSIAELGFGTGLNFLETWRQWRATRQPGQQLVFTSFEAYRLDKTDMERALGVWDRELGDLARRLLDRWPGAGEGDLDWQMDDQTQLRIIEGDAEKGVADWGGVGDVWYLDGFSPAKNPQMWSAILMAEVFGHTVPGGRISTYTAAGWVRRNLEAAGFEISKTPGYAGKREMVVGGRPR